VDVGDEGRGKKEGGGVKKEQSPLRYFYRAVTTLKDL